MLIKYNLNILISFAFLSLGLAATICNDCPIFWTDATHVGMGCLYFNTSRPASWIEAQRSCLAAHAGAHLVEILNQEQQDYMVMKAEEIFALTQNNNFVLPRNWWIGLTDEAKERKFYWPYSFKEVNFTAWARGYPKNDLNSNYVHLSYNADYQWNDVEEKGIKANDEGSHHNYPICQLILSEE